VKRGYKTNKGERIKYISMRQEGSLLNKKLERHVRISRDQKGGKDHSGRKDKATAQVKAAPLPTTKLEEQHLPFPLRKRASKNGQGNRGHTGKGGR